MDIIIYYSFNKIFTFGYFPSDWTEGYIVPLFKKGDRNCTENYMGITILSTIGKLFTRVSIIDYKSGL